MKEEKSYTKREEIWNVATHAFGVVSTLFLWRSLFNVSESNIERFVTSLYSLSLFAMFFVSSFYHVTPAGKLRAMIQKWDHCMIHVLISGTYTPLMLLAVGGMLGNIILILSWSISVIGIVIELKSKKRSHLVSNMMYLFSGWLCILVIIPLYRSLSRMGITCLLMGGIIYSVGVYFYEKRWEFSHAIWHVFVLGGAYCHFAAIYTLHIVS